MKNLLLLVALLSLAGCATTKQWAATGGSRSDGVVRLSYEVSGFEKPRVDEAEGVRLAASRCATWGYTGADAFGGETRQCMQPGGFGGCSRWQVTKEYQCTASGAINPVNATLALPKPSYTNDTQLPAVRQLQQFDETQKVLAAQKAASDMGCGNIRSSRTANEFAARCGDYDLMIQCDGKTCRPVRAVRPTS